MRTLGEILGCRRHLVLDRQIRQKGLDFRRAEGLRVALAVENNEAFNPVDVRLLGADAVVAEANLAANAVEQGAGGR